MIVTMMMVMMMVVVMMVMIAFLVTWIFFSIAVLKQHDQGIL